MRGKAIAFSVRDMSPCSGCEERFVGCHGENKCPKDLRGDIGYSAWLKAAEKVKAQRKQYEDNLRNYKWRVE